jgi:GNAT superfamily N-acetyltransferase
MDLITGAMATHRLLIRTGSPERQREVLLRPATADDVPQILGLTPTTERFKVSTNTDGIDEDELRFWIADERSVVLVAADGSEILAYACGFCVSPKWFFFDTFLVSPRAQNSGLGKGMYAHLRGLCKQRGIELVQGLVKDGDPRALAYWTARGFEEGCRCVWVEDWLDEC